MVNRWVVVSAAFLVMTVGVGTLFSFGVFIAPIEEELGWSRSAVSAAFLVNWLAIGFVSVVMGAASDRIDTRRVVLAGGISGGLGVLMTGWISEVWHLYALFGVLGGVLGGASYAPLTSLVVRRFRDNRSLAGLAAGIVSSGSGAGTFLIAPLSSIGIEEYGWRTQLMLLGLAIILTTLIASAALSEEKDVNPRASDTPRYSSLIAPLLGLRESLRMKGISRVFCSHFLCCFSHSGPYYHLPVIAASVGLPQLLGAVILGFAGLASISFRVVGGYLTGRARAGIILSFMLLYQGSVILAYMLAYLLPDSLSILGPMLGVSFGGVIPLFALVVRDLHGEQSLGTLYGLVFLGSSLGMGLGPVLAGAIYDLTGGYFILFPISGVLSLLAFSLIYSIKYRLGPE